MPSRCVVPCCKTNSSSSREKFTIFSAPRDEERRLVWQKAIPRKDFVLKPTHVVCERHFIEDDIVRRILHKDQFGKILGVGIYNRPKLKPDAVPRLFPGCPAYLSKRVPVKRKSPEERQRIIEGRQHAIERKRRKVEKVEHLCERVHETVINTVQDEEPTVRTSKHLCEGVHGTISNTEQDEGTIEGPSEVHTETESQYMLVPELSLFTQLLSDTPDVIVPESWYRVIPAYDIFCKKRFVVYTRAVCRQFDGVMKPVHCKEVCISEDCEVSFTMLGRPVKLPGISDVLSSLDDVSNVLALADKAKMCYGALLSDTKMVTEPSRCSIDMLGSWRHLGCSILVDTGFQCKRCRNVKTVLKQKTQRQLRKSLNSKAKSATKKKTFSSSQVTVFTFSTGVGNRDKPPARSPYLIKEILLNE